MIPVFFRIPVEHTGAILSVLLGLRMDPVLFAWFVPL
jgi:hypothetical protein